MMRRWRRRLGVAFLVAAAGAVALALPFGPLFSACKNSLETIAWA